MKLKIKEIIHEFFLIESIGLKEYFKQVGMVAVVTSFSAVFFYIVGKIWLYIMIFIFPK
jgi:hypothetical protein